MESVAGEFFTESLISRDVRNSPSFDKIESEFVASLSFYEDNLIKLEKKCRDFIHCLAKAGGPAKDAAIALAEDWEREVLNKHNLKWSLKIDIETSTELSLPSEIPLSSDDEVPKKIQELHDKFILLMDNVRTYYDESKKFTVKTIGRFLTEKYEASPAGKSLPNCKNFDDLFDSVKNHYSFFNFELIQNLARRYPVSDELQLKLDQYMQELDMFKKSTALRQMKDAIKQVPIPHEASKAHCKIVIKLTGNWEEKTVESLERLITFLFKRDGEGRAELIKIVDGSITVTFLALSTAQSLIDEVRNKIQFIQYLGIFQIIINDDIVIEREENVNFTFEDSLLYTINHIDSDAEYEKVALLLIELKIKLNYQNTDGQTALMLSSQGGHIEIFKSLLQNGANPFIQLPANKGFIGLNRLACTAFSQHIYKSIGGEKIIPRDDTSVEEMLEMAVEGRGVSSYFYEPFMNVVKNKIKRKFQLLQDCFHALNSSFVDVATNILTSKALVTEVKQHFQSYIKEDATCENPHQLVQLLQPHYSCLNINLLTIPCTITEPIKEQVEEYNTNLKMFKDTTSLLELGMMTEGMQCPDGVGCSKLILRLNKPWCSRTIAELNEIEKNYLSPILLSVNLIKAHYDTSSFNCIYFFPQSSQTESLTEAVSQQSFFLYAVGVFELMIDDIPIMTEEKNVIFRLKAVLEKLIPNLPLQDGNTALILASEQGNFSSVQFLLSKDPDINIQSNDGYTALMAASANGHHQVVELLLSKDPDMNIQDINGLTALMIASPSRHHRVVELLLSKDQDLNIQDKNGLTALMFASANGDHQVVELLLSKDPDLNIQDKNGLTALMVASANGHHQVVEILLSKDAGINIQNINGWTALMDASRNGHHQVVEILLSKDPNINIQDINGLTALMTACAHRHQQVVELLLSKDPDINIQNNNGGTALMAAIANGHHQVVELLLSKDPDINIQNNNGDTVLMLASDNGNYQLVGLLLSKDPDMNIKNNEGVTALMCASGNGHHKVVELLLSKNPDINIQSNNGVTALIVASHFNYYQIVELLLSTQDLDINIQNYNQSTALMAASDNGHHQVVELLLSKDPDINIQNNNGVTALMAASDNGHYQVVELLLNKDPDINNQDNKTGWTALMAASDKGHHQVVKLLLSKDPDINIQNNNGWTAFMLSSVNKHHQVVELLLSKDPDINIQDNDGWTALMLASRWGHQQVVKLLLSKDPDVNIQNNDKDTALTFASRYGHHQVVELLLSKDPDINIQNNDGWTALIVASGNGHHQVVELLLSKDPDINIQDNNGWTALTFSIVNKNDQIVELILSKDADINIQDNFGETALMVASRFGYHQIVELLLNKDPDINIPNKNGCSATTFLLVSSNLMIAKLFDDIQFLDKLHSSNLVKTLELLLDSHPNHIHSIGGMKLHSLAVAASFNNFDAVTVLMKKCDITPEHIISAFTVASYGGHSSMIIHLSEKITTVSNNEKKLLVTAAEGELGTLISMIYEDGMSPDTPLVAGITPLMIAASCGHIELVDALIQAGADVNKRNDEGGNALDIVSNIMFYDRSDIKELLITNTPAVEPDPVSNYDELTEKKFSTVTVSIKSIFHTFKSFMTKAYNPTYAKQKEMKISSKSGITDRPYSAMTSNTPQFVC